MTEDLRPATVAVPAGRPAHEPDQPLNPPIVMAATYVAGGDLEYGRYGNPTWTALEDVLGALEGGRCLTFASGLAAVSTVLDLVGHGGIVVAPVHSYTGTLLQLADLEARGRITARLVDITDTEAVAAACDDAALVWFESPTNPALELARRLADHSAIGEVRYPGFGAIISVVLAEGAMAADLLCHKTRLWTHATSLGGVESTLERRRRWKAEPATIPDGLVRLSVGIEDVEDLWADLETALSSLVE